MAGECSEDLLCSDCHTIHYSQDGGVPAEWGKEGPYEILLKNIVNELCLMCHDGFDPNAPNVMGETRFLPNAGSFSSGDPNRQHSLESQDKPPGYDGEWNGGPLTCVSCHNPPCNISHGNNKYYRNLKTNPGGAIDITVTYETSEIYGGEAAIQQLLDTPISEKYKVSNIKHRQSESGSNYGISAWCAGCHTDFYGDGGDVNMGGSPSGDTQGNTTDTWIRHPTKGITLSEGVTNLHIDGDVENGVVLGYWWSSRILSRPPYISPSGDIGGKSSSDNETGCISCHKAHGSDQLYCLIFDNPETSDLEDGTRMVGTCQACHLRGGGYYETSPHGNQDSGLLRIIDLAKGECSHCHSQHAGNPYNLFTENKNQLCYTSGCHDFTPTGGSSGYPAQEEDRAPALSGYPGYFEYFSGGERAVGLNNRVRWPGMDVFEDANIYDEGPPERFFSPHRNDPEMPLKYSAGNGLCLNCHSPHGTENPFDMLTKPYLNIGGAGETEEPENYELCFSCHGPDGPGGMDSETRRIADYYNESINPNTAGHMIRKSPGSASYWPPHIQKGDKLSCSNCHNPHGSRGYENNNRPNTRLLSDQRPGWNDLTDTISDAVQCRRFCFGCHVPSDKGDCSIYPSGCPEVDGIIMAQLPDTTDPDNHSYDPNVIKSCYGSATESCHGNDYSSSTSYNVHHPNPSPEASMPRLRARGPILSAPTGLTANAGKRLVELAWDKYTVTDIRGYNLYRSRNPGGPYKLITSQPDIEIRYIDEEVKPERNYYYVLTVEDINGKESPYSIEIGATPTSLTTSELKTLEGVKGLSAKVKKDRIILEWDECLDELVAGYKIYRRKEGETVDSVLITPDGPVRWPVYEDTEIEKDQIYIYSVVAVDKMGNEARFPNELRVIYKELFISKIFFSQEERPLRAGQEMIVTLIGSVGGAAYFTIEGLSDRVSMEEIEDTGTYTGRYIIPAEINDAQVGITCFLGDLKGNKTSMTAPKPLRIDNLPPIPPMNLKAAVLSEKGISLDWKVVGEKKDNAAFRIYRSSDQKIKIGPDWIIASDLPKDVLEYKDLTTMPDTAYRYVITSVDEAGNESEPSNEVEVFTLPDKIPPGIISMQIIGGMGVWKTGDTIILSMVGESGCEARFSIGHNIKDILMQESLGTGKYIGQYVFRDNDKADDMQIIGKLTDASGNIAIFEPDLRVSVALVSDGTRPEVYGLEENSFRIGGDEGLVAGDVLEVTVRGTPSCYGVFHLGGLVDEEQNPKIDWSGFRELEWRDISGYQIHKVEGPPSELSKETLIARVGIGQKEYRFSDMEIHDKGSNIYLAISDYDGHPQVIYSPKWNIPLIETEEQGVYQVRYIVKPGDRMINGYGFVSLKDKFGRSSVPFQSLRTITIDTESRIEVRPVPSELKADSRSRSLIKITLKDIKGNSVPGRQVGVALFTTSEYTGLVGSGRIHQSDIGYLVNASMGIVTGLDNIEKYIFTTDHYGEIEVDFETGFAAKTVIFRARDLITGDIGIGYCTSYIEAQAQVEQYLPIRAREQRYPILLSANPKWLTADGVSTSRITATVKSELGEPLKGYKVEFFISDGYGHLLQNQALTNDDGLAEVVYRAGKRVGTVKISARVTIGNKDFIDEEDIILKSDAPARISMSVWDIKCENMLYNEKNDRECKILQIPADGKSKCRLKIKVTDINGNPSRGVGLVLSHNGDGSISSMDETTDFNGEAEAIYESGLKTGIVSFNLRVTSKIPTSEELDEIRWLR